MESGVVGTIEIGGNDGGKRGDVVNNPKNQDNLLALGIDFGTSGARAIAIDSAGQIAAAVRATDVDGLSTRSAIAWQAQLTALFDQLPLAIRRCLRAIAINGTSSTVVLCDRVGQILDQPLRYDDDRGRDQLAQIQAIAPRDHVTHSATSSLAKLLWWRSSRYGGFWPDRNPPWLLHQADWLAAQLHGHWGITDYHNGLKLGGDPTTQTYPDWLMALDVASSLPRLCEPGEPIAPILSEIAARWDLPADCWVYAGTTDSIAAFLASGAIAPGQAVTSLGSTLALKLLSDRPVSDGPSGIYSHYLGRSLLRRLRGLPTVLESDGQEASQPQRSQPQQSQSGQAQSGQAQPGQARGDRPIAAGWLVGGASNAGGRVLRDFFTDHELRSLSAKIDPTQASPLDYYPLLAPGERFPICDPQLPPRMEPRPADRATFLHGLLESLARIEAQGYRLLQERGATAPTVVLTAGGGAQNPVFDRATCPVRCGQLPKPRRPMARRGWPWRVGWRDRIYRITRITPLIPRRCCHTNFDYQCYKSCTKTLVRPGS
ncbi:MAG: carbohydrate kinase [Oscillatoriales cyanobacterium]|nr:MAG: carbohydrate kinase [Oscillatoriales cyanobacterium]